MPILTLTPEEQAQILEYVKASQADSDPASMMVIGDRFSTARGCVVVLKGSDATRWMHTMLVAAKLLTPGKPITGEAPKKL